MNDASTLTNAGSWAATPPPSLEDFLASMAVIRARTDADDREVHRFDGSLAEFEAGLAAAGCLLDDPRGAHPLVRMAGLQVREMFGRVYVGSAAAFDRLLNPLRRPGDLEVFSPDGTPSRTTPR